MASFLHTTNDSKVRCMDSMVGKTYAIKLQHVFGYIGFSKRPPLTIFKRLFTSKLARESDINSNLLFLTSFTPFFSDVCFALTDFGM